MTARSIGRHDPAPTGQPACPRPAPRRARPGRRPAARLRPAGDRVAVTRRTGGRRRGRLRADRRHRLGRDGRDRRRRRSSRTGRCPTTPSPIDSPSGRARRSSSGPGRWSSRRTCRPASRPTRRPAPGARSRCRCWASSWPAATVSRPTRSSSTPSRPGSSRNPPRAPGRSPRSRSDARSSRSIPLGFVEPPIRADRSAPWPLVQAAAADPRRRHRARPSERRRSPRRCARLGEDGPRPPRVSRRCGRRDAARAHCTGIALEHARGMVAAAVLTLERLADDGWRTVAGDPPVGQRVARRTRRRRRADRVVRPTRDAPRPARLSARPRPSHAPAAGSASSPSRHSNASRRSAFGSVASNSSVSHVAKSRSTSAGRRTRRSRDGAMNSGRFAAEQPLDRLGHEDRGRRPAVARLERGRRDAARPAP